jgi:hypothetical protein
MALEVPESFESYDMPVAPIVVREGIDERQAGRVLDLIADTDWSALSHAYGPATNTAAQLAAVVVGDRLTRKRAWDNLWGNLLRESAAGEGSEKAEVDAALRGRGPNDRASA